MKQTIPLLFLFAFFIVSCDTTDDIPTPNPPVSNIDCDETPEACNVTKSNNAFGFKLFQTLHNDTPDENIFISPMSVATALSMTVNGAKGQTKADMMATLEQNNISLEAVNDGFLQLLNLLPALDPEVELNLANSIWYREGFQVRQDFLTANEEHYDSEVASLNFADPAARETINAWVDDKTQGLIESIVDEPISSDVVMYLINAIFFKGAWLHEFDPEHTYATQFRLEDGSTTEVDMMTYNQTLLNYFETENFQAVDLPYGDSIYTMSLFLPKQDANIDDIIASLNNDNWAQWSESYFYQDMYFGMPRFEMEYDESLVKALSSMGMSIAFGGGCDLTGIADADLVIDEVKHKAFIEVNEEGTEAAAVTSVVIIETSAPQIPSMYLNRPFIFTIRENQSNNVLFMGKMMNPNE
ncbi:MAG: serpin family protein [Chitinophagales bacterium]|nr:serpin family protein [Chitinophagales bacterium]